MRYYIRAAGVSLLALALCIVGWLVWELKGTDYVAEQNQHAAISQLKTDWANGKTALPSSTPTGYSGTLPGDDSDEAAPEGQGTPFALMYIPRFGTDYVQPVLEATSLNQLKDGVGHGIGTAMPGQIGNVGIAGHRTTWGKPLRKINELRNGDEVKIVTANATYVYKVYGHAIVKPSDVGVWAPVPNHPGQKANGKYLTLSACHPLYSADERYVVFTKEVSAVHR